MKDNIFYWHHIPEKNKKNTAIIIIGPIGPEYMPCHRSIKLLADKLSLIGFHCIRYDPVGMGNSSGNLEDPGLWGKWVNTPRQFENYLKNKCQLNDVILIGLRSGCLILSEALKNTHAHSATFWHPVLRGSSFIRGIQLLDSVLYENLETDNNTLEGGGYPFTEELQNDIKNVSLTKNDYPSLKDALIISDKESGNTSKLADRLIPLNIKTESVYLSGLPELIKQVTLSKIPHSNLNFIVDWINKLELDSAEEHYLKHTSPINFTSKKFIETAVTLGPKNIFTILTSPTDNNSNEIIIFANTGAAHHAGPNRMHVDIARNVAEYGFSTLRIDLRNLGDSTDDYTQDPPNEYPINAAVDINVALEYAVNVLEKTKIILCGISAGAHNVFHAAIETHSKHLKKIILINPETFYWDPNQSSFSANSVTTEIDQVYYKKQIYNYRKWLNLFTNPKKLFDVSFFTVILIYKKIKSLNKNILSLSGIEVQNRLEQDLTLLARKKIFISLIYSEGDPGEKILRSQAAKVITNSRQQSLYSSNKISGADHTFSSTSSRLRLYKTILNIVRQK